MSNNPKRRQSTGKKERNEWTFDSVVRRIIHRKDVASAIMQVVVDEFKGMDIKEISKYLPGRGNRIYGLENDDPNSNIVLDVVFQARVPGKNIKVLVNIEPQMRSNPGYPLENRALFYLANRIVKQKGTVFDGDDYGKMEKTYSIWLILEPNRNLQNIIYSSKMITFLEGEDEGTILPRSNMIKISYIHVGSPYDDSNPTMRVINLLFGKGMPEEERINALRENNIRTDRALLEEVREMESLSQQRFEMGREAGLKEGIQQGLEQGREQGLEQGFEQGNHSGKSKCVLALMENLDLDIEEAMEMLDIKDDERDAVRDLVNGSLSQ